MPSVAEQLDQARKNELLDLTLRNPLISYRTLTSRGAEIIDERAAEVYRLLVEEERRMSFNSVSEEQQETLNSPGNGEQYAMVFGQPEQPAPEASDAETSAAEAPERTSDTDSSDTDSSDTGPAKRHVDTVLQTPYTSAPLQKRLLNTFYHAQRSLQEEGINTLYLALGMLHWYRSPSADKERSAPLLLVPVEIDRTDVQGRFRLAYTGDTVGGNLSLRAFLEGEFGLDWPLPAHLDDHDIEARDVDIGAYAQTLEAVIDGQARWRIDPNAIALGFFSFTRFLMFEDLDVANWPADARPDAHPVLRKVLADGFETPEERLPDDVHLDDHLAPEDTHHVVDADSSQTRAILDVKAGCNLVLQGPPGTGKSQTITNIIAEAIGHGQTVLFVSEKMAALEVVKRNLDGVGLGDACLELHSHKTRKKAVLDELECTLRLGEPQVDDHSQNVTTFLQARERLNTYADAVNTPIGESGVRPYRAYGEEVHLRDALDAVDTPALDLPEAQTWTREAHEKRRFLVEQVASHLGGMGVPVQHPFWGSQKTGYLPSQHDAIEDAIRAARASLGDLDDAADALADALGLASPEAPSETDRLLEAATHVADAPDLTGLNVTADVWRTEADALRDVVQAGQRYAALRADHDDVLLPEAWDQDVFSIRQALVKHGTKWYRWFIGAWRQAKGDLAALCQAALPDTNEERVALVDAILDAQRLRETLSKSASLAQAAFNTAWRGTSSDWDRLAALTEALTRAHAAVASGTVPSGTLDALRAMDDRAAVADRAETLRAHRERHHEAATAFAEAITLDASVRFVSGTLPEQPYAEQQRMLNACEGAVPRIQQVVTYNQLARELHAKALGAVEQVARTWDAAADHLVDLFDQTYYTALLQRAMDERPILRGFSGEQHERVIERFRALDRASLQHNRHVLALQHYEQKPRRSGTGQMGVLLHEFGKKRRHMPLRRLMQKAGNAIQALKPIFMMSPMSVPKYLPPESVTFDLVVFDEASQVRPVDAFGSILRGEQTVVVGDSKQLPPTSFFDSAIDTGGDGFEPQAGDQESILDLFRSKGAPEQMLRFHYRSRHESLIAVSNKAFYDNDLNVFPSPDAGQTETGLVYNHLPETTYDRGGSRKNKKEADAVVQRVMKHARTRPEMSLGVATFSSAQQEAIRDRLEHLRRQDPSCESFFAGHPDEPFFVKNLESVQGDQRDVVFISVGYGRDADGKVSMNFGPLNQDGGERRLNVLTTRAKYRCEVFTNLRADDIDLHRTNARGVHVLKEYLKFAETGELDLPTPTGRGPDSPFEKAVAERLEAEGYRVEHQIGVAGFFIDLAVVDPERDGRYVLGIECDGATYHSAKMARVRDRTRQAVLENLGWRIHRIWSTDWFRTPGDEVAEAVAAIERARVAAQADAERSNGTADASSSTDGSASDSANGPPNGSGTGFTSSAPEANSGAHSDAETTASQANTPAGTHRAPQEHATTIERADEETVERDAIDTTPYQKASLRLRAPNGLHNVARETLAKGIRKVVQVESPVHQEVAMRRITSAADVSRMGTRIQKALRRAIAYAVQKGWIGRNGDILQAPGQDEIPVRDRSEMEGRTRDIDYIPEAEIAAAARQIATVSFGIERGELIQQVGRHLGFGRVGSRIRARVSAVLDALLEAERLVQQNGHLAPPA